MCHQNGGGGGQNDHPTVNFNKIIAPSPHSSRCGLCCHGARFIYFFVKEKFCPKPGGATSVRFGRNPGEKGGAATILANLECIPFLTIVVVTDGNRHFFASVERCGDCVD